MLNDKCYLYIVYVYDYVISKAFYT